MRSLPWLLCVASRTALAADQVRIAVSSTSLFFASAYVAKQMRYFDENGLDVSVIDVGSGSNVIASVVGGSAEIGGAGIRNISQGVEKGQALKAFGSSLKGFPNFLVVQKGFLDQAGLKPDTPLNARIASLKGKNIAVNDIGGSAGDFVRELFRRGGFGDRDAVLINISSTPGRLAALKAKRIDALVGYAPEPETAMLEGYGEILINSATDIPEIRSIEYIMWFARAAYHPGEARGRRAADPRARQGDETDEGRHRDGARRLLRPDVRQGVRRQRRTRSSPSCSGTTCAPTSPTAMSITDDGMAGRQEFFHIPATLSDETLIDNSFARRVDAARTK